MPETDKLDEVLARLKRIEDMKAAEEIEGDLDLGDKEEDSQMFTASHELKDPVTGVPISYLTKTRTSDYNDVDAQIWPYAQAFYGQLGKVKDGGAFVYISIEELEDGKKFLEDYSGCRIFEEFEGDDIKGYTVIIYMSWVIERLKMLARISSFDGYSRKEAIHIKGGEMYGQSYVDTHAPAPPMYPKEKGGRAPYQGMGKNKPKSDIQAVQEATFEAEEQ